MTDGVSNEPVIASTPTPISVEPRVAPPAEAAEVARQAEEAKLPRGKEPEPAAKSEEPKDKPRPSIREALAAAREKLDAEPAKAISVAAKEAPTAKAAEPAAVTKDAPVAAAKDSKEAPAAATKDGPVRDETTGKFTKAATDAPADAAKDAPPAATKPAALPSHTAEAPPARFSQAAKEKWAEAPDEVRAEVTRAVTELTKGFEKHREAAERDSKLTSFHELAAKGGTTVPEALEKYVSMENLIRKDPVAGLHEIAKNAGLNLRDVAARILNQTPDQARSESDATIRDLTARLEKAEAALGGIHQEKQTAQTNTTTEMVTKFASDPANSRFEELSDDISFFLKSGRTKDLAEAYKLAERLNPAPASATPAAAASSAPAAAPLPKPTLVPASTAGEKSIAGTPTAGSDPVRKQPSNSIKEALQRARARAG